MPWTQPKTLTDNEVYALTAYILALNQIIREDDVMNAETLPKVKMPNRDGFISKYRRNTKSAPPQGEDAPLHVLSFGKRAGCK